jgi:hypothetical protein
MASDAGRESRRQARFEPTGGKSIEVGHEFGAAAVHQHHDTSVT